MKNAIRYFYNIYATEIIKSNDIYKIKSNQDDYILVLYNYDINILNYIYKFLTARNFYCHEIIFNKDSEMVTNIDNNNFILLKVYIDNKKIGLNDIINSSILLENSGKCNWYNLWCRKLDYYEYQMSQFKKKYPLLYQSFSYYAGLCENAISYITSFRFKKINLYLNHNRIHKNYNTVDFYNPINMILDVKVRDVCEFFKNQFFYIKNPIDDVKYYINNVNFTLDEAILFFARMLYPSYYFDIYDLIIQEKIEEEKIKIITKKVSLYEKFLQEVFYCVSYKYKIPEIEWLIKT